MNASVLPNTLRRLRAMNAAELRFRATAVLRNAVDRARVSVAPPAWDRRALTLHGAALDEARRELAGGNWFAVREQRNRTTSANRLAILAVVHKASFERRTPVGHGSAHAIMRNEAVVIVERELAIRNVHRPSAHEATLGDQHAAVVRLEVTASGRRP